MVERQTPMSAKLSLMPDQTFLLQFDRDWSARFVDPLILAGLLGTQAEEVTAAYRRQRMIAVARIDRGDWPTLVMRKRKSSGWR